MLLIRIVGSHQTLLLHRLGSSHQPLQLPHYVIDEFLVPEVHELVKRVVQSDIRRIDLALEVGHLLAHVLQVLKQFVGEGLDVLEELPEGEEGGPWAITFSSDPSVHL